MILKTQPWRRAPARADLLAEVVAVRAVDEATMRAPSPATTTTAQDRIQDQGADPEAFIRDPALVVVARESEAPTDETRSHL